jgi:hypothetical protein
MADHVAPVRAPSFSVRQMRSQDELQVLSLMETALGWRSHDPNADLFAWKHRHNPFGRSPAWVAVDGDLIVGFRTFMRWEFATPKGAVRAVRAVDTATHPRYQGRGIFASLTLHAINELADEGVAFVFNTPNDKSRPGYLKMGWKVVGHLPAGIQPHGLGALPRIAAARVPAELMSIDSDAGMAAADALADDTAVRRLLAALPRPSGFVTALTPEYLRWRYGFAPLRYRALLAGNSLEKGLLLFRLRRRGAALELSVSDLLLPRPSPWGAARLIRAALQATGADYALGLCGRGGTGLVPVPRQGPLLTCRPLAAPSTPAPRDWGLSLGDVELF